jgi:hypothetical protein
VYNEKMMKTLLSLFIIIPSLLLAKSRVITIPMMYGNGYYYNVLGENTFENGMPKFEIEDNLKTPTQILLSDKGAFVSHNNGMKELRMTKLGKIALKLEEEYPEDGVSIQYVLHFGITNEENKSQFLVTCTKTKARPIMTLTNHSWGWATIKSN